MSQPTWAKVREYGAQFQADLAVAILEAEGIPTLVKGPGAGVFGPGMAGFSPIVVSLFVPSDAIEFARELLEPSPEAATGE